MVRHHTDCTVKQMAKDLQIHLSWLETELFRLFLIHQGSTGDLPLLQISSGVVWQSRDLHLSRNTLYLLGHRLCFFIVDLFLAKHNVEYSMSIPRRDKGCTPILVRLLRQINRIKPCGYTKICTCCVCLCRGFTSQSTNTLVYIST